MRRKNRTFKVKLDIPPDADEADVIEYIESSVKTWRGSLRPPESYGPDDDGDPMWALDPETVKVTK